MAVGQSDSTRLSMPCVSPLHTDGPDFLMQQERSDFAHKRACPLYIIVGSLHQADSGEGS